jgi:hypothetical protein
VCWVGLRGLASELAGLHFGMGLSSSSYLRLKFRGLTLKGFATFPTGCVCGYHLQSIKCYGWLGPLEIRHLSCLLVGKLCRQLDHRTFAI